MSNLDHTTLKAGDVFYECHSGYNYMLQVITPPALINQQWKWKAINMTTGENVDLLIDPKYRNYGPQLYNSPQYCRFKDGEITFEYS